MIIQPSYQNFPGTVYKPANVLFSAVYQTITANPIITLTNGLLYLPQSGYTFPQRIFNIKRFDVIPYAAGTTGSYTVNVSSVTNIAPGNVYKLQIISGNGQYNSTAVVVSTGSTPTQLSIDLGASLNGLSQSGVFTYSVNSGSSIVTINEANAATGGFALIPSNTLMVVSTVTANVAPSGSLTQAQAYNPNITAGAYNIYRWKMDVTDKQASLAGSETLDSVTIDVLVNTLASGFATADNQIQQFGSGFPNTPSTYSASWLANILGIPA